MTFNRIHPREDQVAELTRGQSLPLAPLHEVHLRFIAEVLMRAWNDLLVDRSSMLLTAEEPEVNALIETRLNALLGVDDRWSQLVCGVARGEK